MEIGLSDLDFVEVIAGVKQGEKVIANSHSLPDPEPGLRAEAQGPAVATASFRR